MPFAQSLIENLKKRLIEVRELASLRLPQNPSEDFRVTNPGQAIRNEPADDGDNATPQLISHNASPHNIEIYRCPVCQPHCFRMFSMRRGIKARRFRAAGERRLWLWYPEAKKENEI